MAGTAGTLTPEQFNNFDELLRFLRECAERSQREMALDQKRDRANALFYLSEITCGLGQIQEARATLDEWFSLPNWGKPPARKGRRQNLRIF